MPNCLNSSICRVAKILNTVTITIAALVTAEAAPAMPWATARSVLMPRS